MRPSKRSRGTGADEHPGRDRRAASAADPVAWGLRPCALLVVLTFAPEWTLEPVATRGPEMRIMGVVVALAALVLLASSALSLRSLRSEPEPDIGPPGAPWIEVVEVVLALALVASVLGGAATALPVLEGVAPMVVAVVAVALIAVLGLAPVSLPAGVAGVATGAALLAVAVLVVTGGLNFVQVQAVPITPGPVMAVEAWRALPLRVVLESFGMAGATVAGLAAFTRAGRGRGGGWLALALGVLFLLIVAMHVTYGMAVGDGTPAIFPAVFEVFGGVRPVSWIVVAALAWILTAAMVAHLRRGEAAAPGRRGPLLVALAAGVVVVAFRGSVGVLAALWVLAALAWVVPTHGALLARELRRGRAVSGWRAVAHGFATVGTLVAALGALLFLTGCVRPAPEKRLDEVRLPPGFTIEVYVDGIEEARQMALGADGTLYVGTKTLGRLYAVPDRDGDGRGDEVIELARDLDHSNGVAVRGDTLYVAETSHIVRYPGISGRLDALPEPELVMEIPWRDYHMEAYIRFGPDGALYATLGSPCDTCLPDHPILATIARLPASQAPGAGLEPDFEVVAEGVRNSMGFDWHPETGEIWFTDNARDWLGDHTPPDELNRIPGPEVLHFGFPHCHGRSVRDPEFGEGVDCSRFEPPVLELEAHAAVLAATFYDGEAFPPAYRNVLFMAEHGSYNRSDRSGYRVTMATGLAPGEDPELFTFLDGFLTEDGDPWARPVDIIVMPDGSLLVSDDFGDAIYRIRYDPAAVE